MKLKLTNDEKAELIPQIQRVLDTGKGWNADLLHHPAGAIIKAALSIKGLKKAPNEESREGFTTNGWEYDWCQDFEYKGKLYTLSGSGFLGGHSFHLSDE